MRRALLLSTLVLLALPAAASAAATPERPILAIHFQRLVAPQLAFVKQAFRIKGVITPFVPGQSVIVRIFRGKKKVLVIHRRIQRRAGTSSGRFFLHVTARVTGRLTVRASHAATPGQPLVIGRRIHVRVIGAGASFGSSSPVVRLLQRGLDKLGYAVSRSGTYDAATGRAVLAYRKVNGLARVQTATPDIVRNVLAGRGAFHARYPSHGRHVEADLGRQVLAELDGGRVHRVYILSSGKPSTPTVLGSFRVYSKTPGTNAKGMFDSNYFHGGYAIHGYPDVPVYAASHGCLRVPNPDAPTIFGWVQFGTIVDVYP